MGLAIFTGSVLFCNYFSITPEFTEQSQCEGSSERAGRLFLMCFFSLPWFSRRQEVTKLFFIEPNEASTFFDVCLQNLTHFLAPFFLAIHAHAQLIFIPYAVVALQSAYWGKCIFEIAFKIMCKKPKLASFKIRILVIKGQTISKANHGVLNSSKNGQKITILSIF